MNPLPESFRLDGFDFQMICRQGRVALFEKTKPGWISVSYEAVIVHQRSARQMFGRDVPAHEAMSSAETWGTYGWSYAGRQAAQRRFNELVETHQDAPL